MPFFARQKPSASFISRCSDLPRLETELSFSSVGPARCVDLEDSERKSAKRWWSLGAM